MLRDAHFEQRPSRFVRICADCRAVAMRLYVSSDIDTHLLRPLKAAIGRGRDRIHTYARPQRDPKVRSSTWMRECRLDPTPSVRFIDVEKDAQGFRRCRGRILSKHRRIC